MTAACFRAHANGASAGGQAVADLAYIGTRFTASKEANATDATSSASSIRPARRSSTPTSSPACTAIT
jgi:NAD(P)H-dependent flavin oxidoreductase YrpB (nitropropane dioxygenase family)